MSNRDLPMMPWYPDQFAASTRAWRYAWRCAYRELLDVQWQTGVLPSDPELLAIAIGCTSAEFAEVWPHIRGKFVPMNGGLVNLRLEEHRLRSLGRKERFRAGAIATNARRGDNVPPSGSPSATLSASPSGSPSEAPSATPLSPSLSPSSKRPDIEGANGAGTPSGTPSVRKPSRRVPPGWEPKETETLKLKGECPGVDLQRELVKFRDHTFGTARSDWDATWRNWVREADERLGRGRGLNGLTRARKPLEGYLTTEQIESEIARGWRDAGGSRIPGKHPDLPLTPPGGQSK